QARELGARAQVVVERGELFPGHVFGNQKHGLHGPQQQFAGVKAARHRVEALVGQLGECGTALGAGAFALLAGHPERQGDTDDQRRQCPEPGRRARRGRLRMQMRMRRRLQALPGSVRIECWPQGNPPMTSAEWPILYRQHLTTMQNRADAALARSGRDYLVVPSGTLHYHFFDDRDYPYAVNPQFKAWLPLTRNPGSWLVYTPGARPKLVYLQPRDYWHVVPQAPSGYWTTHFDIVVVRKEEEALEHLPADPSRCAILGEPQSALGNFVPDNPSGVVDYLEYHRAYKTPYEIAMMREATVRGVRGHRAAERAFRAGASEFGIHLAYCQAAGQDANDLPYGNIVALNEHDAVLHYMDRDRVPPS